MTSPRFLRRADTVAALLVVAGLAAGLLLASFVPGCSDDVAPTAPTEREARAVEAVDRADQAARELMGQATDDARRADSLLAELGHAEAESDALDGRLRRTRAALDSALSSRPDTVRVRADTVRVYVAAERRAADASIAACEERADLARTAAVTARAASLSAYAAADSALYALGHSRTAYDEATARADDLGHQLARTRRTRDLALGAAGVGLAVGVGCSALLLSR